MSDPEFQKIESETGLEKIEFITSDGLILKSLFKRPSTNEKSIIMVFHGNAGHVGHRVEKFRPFLEEGHGEFKSIRVHNNFRNQGYGINVINHLINVSKMLKIKRVSVETGAGNFFLPARKLFEKCDFKVCEPFAHYKKDIKSVYLTKIINTY